MALFVSTVVRSRVFLSSIHLHLRHFHTQTSIQKSRIVAEGAGHRHRIPGRPHTERLLDAESLSPDVLLPTSYLPARPFPSVLSSSSLSPNQIQFLQAIKSLQRHMVISLCQWLLWVIIFASACSHCRNREGKISL